MQEHYLMIGHRSGFTIVLPLQLTEGLINLSMKDVCVNWYEPEKHLKRIKENLDSNL